MSTGITLPYEQAAMRGDPMPSGLSLPDVMMYQALSLLYARFRMKTITREQAISDKKSMLREYEVFRNKWSMGDTYVALIKNTELARANYRFNRSLEAADRLVAVVEGCYGG